MAAKNIKKIKEAIRKNRGGFETASNAQIMVIWQSLSSVTQKQYLESINTNESAKTEGKK